MQTKAFLKFLGHPNNSNIFALNRSYPRTHIALGVDFPRFICNSPVVRSQQLNFIRKIKQKKTTSAELAIAHFDGLYSKVYGEAWPSIRLGLLSPNKQSAVFNTFLDSNEQHFSDAGALNLGHYYKKHLESWLKRTTTVNTNDSDIKSSARLTDKPDDGYSSAEDLMEMFSDRRIDEDEKYFVNKASTVLSLNDFVPATEMISRETISSDLSYYEDYNQEIDLHVEHLEEPSLEFCDRLKIYTFPRSNWTKFEPPSILGEARLFSYYLLDGASVLPVLAINVEQDNICADYCAAPGGKSLGLLMTLRPKYLLCNDISSSRLGRLTKTLRQYVPDVSYMRNTLNIANKDARSLVCPDTFDRILVDVPCSNDRNSAGAIENNIFKRTRTDERLSLPSKQCKILKAALKSLRAGGAAVYSTCTMSPVENDGVVHRALAELQVEGHPSRFAIMNLKEAFRPLRGLYKFYTEFKFGQLVLPDICNNSGPLYICKIKRIK